MAQPASGKKYAVLVGIKFYNHSALPDLEYTERDVEELGALLEKAGYHVTLLTSSSGEKDAGRKPTLAQIRKALETTLKDVTKRDTVLIGLAGHGVQPEGSKESYFCPMDAKPKDVSTLLPLTGLVEQLNDSGVGVKLLLVDAFRNDPGRGSCGVDGSRVEALPRGAAALFSCSEGERAFETKKAGGGHGVFFHFVLEGLRGAAKNEEGEVTWGQLSEFVARKVRRTVPELIGGGARQTPNEVKNLEGESPVMVVVSASPSKPIDPPGAGDTSSTPTARADTILVQRFHPVQRREQSTRSIVNHLLLGHAGLIDISSCARGQAAYGNFFTPLFVKRMTAWEDKGNPSWQEFFNVVKEETEKESKVIIQSQVVGEGDGQTKQSPYSFRDLLKVTAVDRSVGVIRGLVIVDNNGTDDSSYLTDVHADAFEVYDLLNNLGDLCPNPRVLSKKTVTRDVILNTINRRMEVGPNDTLFVYFIGRGAQDTARKGVDHELGHVLNTIDVSETATHRGVGRWELVEAMKSRKAKLAILVTDSGFAPVKPKVKPSP
jgi:uncharacterized caspase-like protein